MTVTPDEVSGLVGWWSSRQLAGLANVMRVIDQATLNPTLPGQLYDGNRAYGSLVNMGNGPVSVTVDLGTAFDIDHVNLSLYWGDSLPGRAYVNLMVEVSPDNATWTTAYGPTDWAPAADGIEGLDVPVGASHRYVRVSDDGNSINGNNEWVEIEVWASLDAPADGDPLLAWPDASGNLRTLHNPTPSGRPILEYVDGVPVVTFDGADMLWGPSGFDGTEETEYSVMLLCRIFDTSGDHRPFGAADSGSGAQGVELYGLGTYWVIRGAAGGDLNMGSFGAVHDPDAFNNYEVVIGSGGAEAYIDGVARGTSGATSTRPMARVALGAGGDLVVPAHCQIIEAFVHDHKLTSGERTDLEGYMAEVLAGTYPPPPAEEVTYDGTYGGFAYGGESYGGGEGGSSSSGPSGVSVEGPPAIVEIIGTGGGIVRVGSTISGPAAILTLSFDDRFVTYVPPPPVEGVDGGTQGSGEGGTDGPAPPNDDGVDEEPQAYDGDDIGASTDGEDDLSIDDPGSGGGSVFVGTGPDPDDYIPVVWDPYPAGLPVLGSYSNPKRRSPIRRHSLTWPPPTLNLYGRPVDWAPSSRIREDWGVVKVYCGTTDVTTFRGVHTRILQHEYMEPFGYGPAVLAFPQISSFDTLNVGTLGWFKQGMNVTLKRVMPDGRTEKTIWEGLASSWEPAQDDAEYEFELHCIGALHQSMLEPYPPRFSKAAIDVGLAIADALNTQPARRFAALPLVNTGILTRNRGSWDSRFDYILELLSTAYTSDGNNQWTIGCSPGRFPVLRLKNLATEHWTITNGAQGVILREKSDVTTSKNAIFGEGVDEDGGRWRNSRYPTVTGAPTFRPLTWVTQNEPYTYSADGVRTGRNPNYDRRRLRVAVYENFGMGVTFDEGVKSARAELKRDVNPGWFGTCELEIDPEQGSKFDIRAGQNVAIRHHHGFPKRLFHIAHVEAHLEENKVILTIDTNARDSITLSSIEARNREAAKDPARRLSPPRRISTFVPDERSAWDAESGAGRLSNTALTAGEWRVKRIPASDYGSIVRTIFTSSANVKFAVGIFSKAVSPATLDSLVGNPFTQDSPWDDEAQALSDRGLLVAWGSKTQAMGYYPSSQDVEDAPITGDFRDDSAWDFVSDDVPWVWVAMRAAGDTVLSGRLYISADDA